MPTYKDVDEIRKEILQGKKNLHFKNAENAEICAVVLAFVEGVIDRVPEADVEPVKHGEWVYGEFDIPRCSECGGEIMPHLISIFCPNCGTKMDGESNA